MKKRFTIGYIFCERKEGKEEKEFNRQAKKKNIELIKFNLSKDINEKEIEDKAQKCQIIFNNSGEEFSQEFIKTLEELGKKVIDSSESFYYTEDKWMFYLKCNQNKIPVPRTILLSENINIAKKQIKDFNHWPIILKRIEGTCGEFVEKANSLSEAENIMKKFWKKGSEKIPIIAQEFIYSNKCYRVLTIDGETVQSVIKENKNWKQTGVFEKRCKRFKVDKDLKEIIKNIRKITKINICGIDLIKKQNEWIVLEVNTVPALDFILADREKIIGKILDLLIKGINKTS